jgi:hypothetical protein
MIRKNKFGYFYKSNSKKYTYLKSQLLKRYVRIWKNQVKNK